MTLSSVEPVDAQDNLRYLLNQWDPIGVADVVIDQYDCMIGPLLSMLNAGAGRAEIGEFLWYELDEHFGLSPESRGTDQLADRLVAWWAAAGGSSQAVESLRRRAKYFPDDQRF